MTPLRTPWLPPPSPRAIPARAAATRRPGRRRPLWAKEKDIRQNIEEAQRWLSLWAEESEPTLRPVFDVIHERLFDSTFTATEATEAMSRKRDRLLFLRATGGDLRTYIENGRLLAASRLLTVPDIEMYLIADAVGYDHYATFSRAFLRRVGCSPSEYRQLVLSAEEPRHGELTGAGGPV